VAVARLQDGGHVAGAERDRDATGPCQHCAIELQPARRASLGQPAFAHHDVGASARSDQFAGRHEIGASRREDPPDALPGTMLDQAEIAAAARLGLVGQEQRLSVHAAILGQHVGGIIADAITQQRQSAPRRANGDVAAIAGDEQIGRRRRQRPTRTQREG
jgi:hypothetical protein